MTLAERFWSKVQKTDGPNDCWLWQGARHDKGYGHFRLHGRVEKAARVAWALTRGSIPDGVFVCHCCDNPPCVRPDHLFLGTDDENRADRQSKERQARGERAGRVRLTADAVREIRRIGRSLSGALLASRFGVGKSTIAAVLRRESWRHLAVVLLCWTAIASPIRTIDGDTAVFTLSIWPGLTAQETVRILLVNTPERRGETREAGDRARAYTAEWLARGPVQIKTCGRDAFGRVLGTVTRGSEDLGGLLLKEGLAVPFRR
jgi:endonuclease YncB( thermonuclease family)